jgi:hypothetical protein
LRLKDQRADIKMSSFTIEIAMRWTEIVAQREQTRRANQRQKHLDKVSSSASFGATRYG